MHAKFSNTGQVVEGVGTYRMMREFDPKVVSALKTNTEETDHDLEMKGGEMYAWLTGNQVCTRVKCC